MLKFLPLLWLLVFLFASAHNLKAQQGEWQGVVIDSADGVTLQGVVIYYSAERGARSQADGHFSLQIDSLPIQVKVAYTGYFRRNIWLTAFNPAKVDTIYLIPDLPNIGQVVITASRQQQRLEEVTQSAEVVSSQLLVNTQTNQVQQLMEKLPGVQVQKDQVTIRGGSGFSYGSGSRVMMLLDEMPILSADAGDAKWSYYPVENLEQIEVIKGPSSSLYGSSAMEGIIHLRTALPADTAYTQVRQYLGFYGKPRRKETTYWTGMAPLRSGLTIAHRQRFGDLGVTASLYSASDAGFREGDNNGIRRGNLRLNYTPKKLQKWAFGMSLNGMKTEGQNFLLFGDSKQPYKPLAGTVSNYTYYRWHTDASIRYYASNRTRHILRGRYFSTINQNNTNQNSTGNLLFTEYQFQRMLFARDKKETSLTSGITFTHSSVISDSFYGNHAGDNAAAYAQIDQKLNRFNFNMGGRLEMYKVDTYDLYVFPVFRAGLNYQAAKGSYLRASFGQGFRYPSISERFAQTAAGSIKIFPNAQLAPEKGWGSELGYRQLLVTKAFNGYVDISGFWMQFDNMIEYVFGLYPPPGVPPSFNYFGFKAKNVRQTRIRGAEISAGVQKKWKDLTMNFLGGYTYIVPLNDTVSAEMDTTGYMRDLKYRRRHLLRANLEFNYKRYGLGIYTSYSSPLTNVDGIFLDVIANLKKNDYWRNYSEAYVTDVRLSMDIIRKFNLSFFVKNVFNKEYMEMIGNTNAPRTYIFQITAVF